MGDEDVAAMLCATALAARSLPTVSAPPKLLSSYFLRFYYFACSTSIGPLDCSSSHIIFVGNFVLMRTAY